MSKTCFSNNTTIDRMTQSTLLKNVFLRDTVPASQVHLSETKTYNELRTVEKPNGFVQELVTVDYPITAEYVASYADGADYHKDPLGAQMRATPRRNLGDITDVQSLLNSDISGFKELLFAVADKFKNQETSKASEAVKASEVSQTVVQEGGSTNE